MRVSTAPARRLRGLPSQSSFWEWLSAQNPRDCVHTDATVSVPLESCHAVALQTPEVCVLTSRSKVVIVLSCERRDDFDTGLGPPRGMPGESLVSNYWTTIH